MNAGEQHAAREISRRSALRILGAAGAGAALAACTGREGTPAEPSLSPLPSKVGMLSVASWHLYLDVDEATGRHPTIETFTQKTGIRVDYREVITDADAFVAAVQPDLDAGKPPAWDLAVISSRLVPVLARRGYLEPLHHDALPNFDTYAGPLFRSPSYDPRNTHSIPWQGGITGIGYDPSLTLREITKISDLFDPAFAGRVGLFSEMLDTMSLMLLHLGVEPERASLEDARRAADLLRTHRRNVKGFYTSDYSDALARGDLALTMAWSSDIFQLQADNPELLFVVPEEGSLVWNDDMVILSGARHPTDAHAWMNHYYDPVVAANVAAYVNYVTPVPAAREILLAKAARLKDAEERADLERIANTSLIFPSQATVSRLHRYPVLSDAQDRAWNALFEEVVAG